MIFLAKAKGKAARIDAAAEPPFGAGFGADVVAQTEVLEVHGTEFSAPGVEYCEFRAFDSRGNLIGTKKVNGY